MAKLNLAWPGDPPPNVNALGVLLDLAYNWRMTFWLNLRLSVDPRTRQHRRIIISEGHRDELLFLAINHEQLLAEDSYVAYWRRHYTLLYADVNKGPNPHHFITHMYESASVQGDVIRTLLAMVRKHPKSPTVTTVGEIERFTGGSLNSTNWLQRLREHVFLRAKGSVTESTEVLVSDPMLLESIGRLFTTYGDAEIIRQLSWEFVQLHILALDKTPLEISFLGRRYAVPYVAMYCSRYVESIYGPLLASLYARLHLTLGDRRALDANLAGLLEAAIDKTRTSSWLTAESKREAVEKLQSVRTVIWPPKEYFTDDGLEEAYVAFPRNKSASFLANWLTARETLRRSRETPLYAATIGLHHMISFSLVDYDYLTNDVYVAMSALTNPVYYPRGSRSMFYGGLGFLYSSEMLKVLDETGRQIRADGRIVDSWLSPEEVNALERKRNCHGVRHNGSFLASLGALELAYSRFQATREVGGDHVVSRNFTEAQVFFFTVCRILCDLPSAEATFVSCNSLLRNSPEFATTFGCQLESSMNPKEKCRYFDAS
ncbi:hypothetical protein V5799_025978 [Amblyomma americanum]|uniref:Uncharacterized protein n=1 Tax=Amblyomma americanum TaxID=6943 RepID=A0AAQ4DJW6_AMBAM